MIFKHYNLAESRKCGEEFVEDFRMSPKDIKSKHILRWFAATAPPEIRVYGHHLIEHEHEYVVDQCHTTFPKPEGDERWHKRWVRALNQTLQFRLALESEWGSAASHSENLARILDDAWKVAMVRANVKVMVFATTTSKKALPIVGCLEKLRSQSGDVAPWLCIDIPWSQKRLTPRHIVQRILF